MEGLQKARLPAFGVLGILLKNYDENFGRNIDKTRNVQ